MNFEVVMKDKIYDKLFCLMNNINNINGGSEIGAWMLGDWKKEDDTIRLVIDNFIIPKQKVSGVEVDMSPESMIDVIKEVGNKEANRIKAHWHIHPFSDGDTNWSGGDENKINDFMDPIKKRQIFVFMLSSRTKLKARIELVAEWKVPMFDTTFIQRKTIDDLEVKRETEVTASPYLEELTTRIKEKVEKISYDTSIYKRFSKNLSDVTNEGEPYIITSNANYIRVKMTKDFYDYVHNLPDDELKSLANPTHEREKGVHIQWGYACNTWLETHEKEEKLQKDLEELEEQFNALKDIQDNGAKYYEFGF